MRLLCKNKPEDLMVTRMREAEEARTKTRAERTLRPVSKTACGVTFPHRTHVFYVSNESPLNNCDGSVVR